MKLFDFITETLTDDSFRLLIDSTEKAIEKASRWMKSALQAIDVFSGIGNCLSCVIVEKIKKKTPEPAKEKSSEIPEEDILQEAIPRGRPVVTRLCSKFRDSVIWPLAKFIHQKINKTDIQESPNPIQFLTCYLCSLFRIDPTEVIDGKVAHFHRLMMEHIGQKLMPSLRHLQRMVRWLRTQLKFDIYTVKEQKEEAKHRAWENLEEQIYGYLKALAPQYAIM